MIPKTNPLVLGTVWVMVVMEVILLVVMLPYYTRHIPWKKLYKAEHRNLLLFNGLIVVVLRPLATFFCIFAQVGQPVLVGTMLIWISWIWRLLRIPRLAGERDDLARFVIGHLLSLALFGHLALIGLGVVR